MLNVESKMLYYYYYNFKEANTAAKFSSFGKTIRILDN